MQKRKVAAAPYLVPNVAVDAHGRRLEVLPYKDARRLAPEEFEAASAIESQAPVFTSFLVRKLQRKPMISSIMRDCTAACVAEVEAREGRPFDEYAPEVVDAVAHPRYAVDTVYSDVYRALVGEAEQLREERTVAGDVLRHFMQHKSFNVLSERVQANPVLGGVYAAKAVRALMPVIRKTFADALAQGDEAGEVKEPASVSIMMDGLEQAARNEMNSADLLDVLVAKIAGTGVGEHVDDLLQLDEVTRCIENELSDSQQERNYDSVQTLVDCIGHVEDAVAQGFSPSSVGDGEDVEVELGGSLFKAIPSELMNLTSPETEILLLVRCAEQQVLQMNRYGIDEGGKGPIVVLLDSSWSMSSVARIGDTDYTLLTVAKAVALALLRVAVSWRRTMLILPFDTQCVPKFAVTFNNRTAHTTRWQLDAATRRLAGMSVGGGTAWVPSLVGARRFMEQYDADTFDNSDVIYITDGAGELPLSTSTNYTKNEGIARIKETFGDGTSFYGLLIDGDFANAKKSAQYEEGLSYFFDHTVAVAPDGLLKGIGRLAEKIARASFYSYAKPE